MALFADDKRVAPDIYNPPPELAEGVREVTDSVESGDITQEEGNELIAHLYSAWTGAALSNMVVNELERGIAPSFPDASQNKGVRSESERIRAREESASDRRYKFAYISVGLTAAVGMVVFFALTDNLDMAIPIVTAAAGFLGGLIAGRLSRG